MKIGTKTKSFDPHPEYEGPAVCVDCTPPKIVQSEYGPREQFRLVFETQSLREDGKPHLVWSRGFTPSLHEKAALRTFLKQWLGRDLSAAEQAEFDTELLVGKPCLVTIVHNTGGNGEIYANIGLIRPDRGAIPLKPSGKYIRVKDREAKGNGDTSYQRAEQPQDSAASEDWRRVKVHVGKHAGIEICDLDRDAILKLVEHWLPEARLMPKPLKADRDLMGALEKATAQLGLTRPPVEDDLNY